MYYVYVIQSQHGKIYTGHTSDLEKRLFEHNSGMCKTTKEDSRWRLIYSEDFETRGEAMKRERWLKTGVGRDYIRGIIDGD
ncbi:MAG: GIY-YIG nuclease family protein [candidate division Zixibacteria bacterium]|nr:GIY-YIG nuclease family protein [candidate division Zixibacteria bacterium]